MPTQVYHDKVTDLFDAYYTADKNDKPSSHIRVRDSSDIIEQYFEEYGTSPPNSVLSRLATYILLDDLSDPYPDKMSRDEYPIMSYGQTGRYFARNGKLKDVPYEHSEVMGFLIGKNERTALINPTSADQKAIDWRLFIREILTERESLIVEGIYEQGATQAEMADELGVSRQRVGVILTKALDKVGEAIRDEKECA